MRSETDIVGTASLISAGTITNSSAVLSGGALTVSASALTNNVNASLASTAGTTVNASSFVNAGVVNGTTTTITVSGALNNTAGDLMGLTALSISAASLNNQNGLIFAGDASATSSTTSSSADLSLTLTGGNGSFANAAGQVLAERNVTLDAANMGFDPSQGTIGAGGQLSITANTINVASTLDFAAQSVLLDGLNGITNSGTISSTAPLTLTTGGTFTNSGEVDSNDLTLNGTIDNTASGILHASDALAINGSVTNRGTVEAGTALTVTGTNYDNQGATTQSTGTAIFTLSGTLQNTGGTIAAGGDITINAAAVVNDQTPSTSVTTTSAVSDLSVLLSGLVGSENIVYVWKSGGHDSVDFSGVNTVSATLSDLLASSGTTTEITNKPSEGGCAENCRVSGSSSIYSGHTATFYEYQVDSGNSNRQGIEELEDIWVIQPIAGLTALASTVVVLPTEYETVTTETIGTAGVISSGGALSLTANSLSNRGGEIAATGNLSLNVQSLSNGAIAPTQTFASTTFVA